MQSWVNSVVYKHASAKEIGDIAASLYVESLYCLY